MARQPIFDRRGVVTAYELLFRDSNGRSVQHMTEKEEASALAQSLVDIGLDRLVGKNLAFVNIPTAMLAHPAVTLLPPDRVVLEVLEDVEPTPEVIQAMKDLLAKGYTVALDDFVFDGRLDSLLPYCQLVKVEYPAADRTKLRRDVAKLKAMGIVTLAEKVEEKVDQKLCMDVGFDLFQGYYFAKPELVNGSAVKTGSGTLIQLLQELQNPDVSIGRVEDLLGRDARLTHQLLRIARSAALGAGAGVTSIRAALMTIGITRVSALVGLMMMAERSGTHSDLLTLGTVRAKLGEELSRRLKLSGADRHFTVGLLSVLDAVLGRPMPEVLAEIPLAADLKSALLDPSDHGDLSNVLNAVIATERGDWSVVQSLGLRTQDVSECAVLAIQWSDEIKSQMAA
jgi:EAL and modified HD-GYP domain-containing signal transduction protein